MINVVQNGELYEITFPYDIGIITLIKNVPGRRWNSAGKMWTVPKDRLGFFINEFQGTRYEPLIKIHSDEELNQNAEIGKTQTIPDIDISDITFHVKEGSTPYQHQLDFMKWAIARQRSGNMDGFICADEMGCISGDALIHLNFRKSYSQITLRELYQHWIARPQYHDRGNYKVRCLRDDVFRLHDVYNIVYSGDKPVYKLMLSGGYYVKCTADHEILTDKGYVQLQELEIGDNVVTNGQLACPRCGTTENICTYKEAKYYGFCRKCMYKLRDEARRTSYSEIQDADGYILCRGKDIPKWHGFTWSGYIYKHRLVMEEYLDRRLLPDEVVHHINGVRDDNRLENLELTDLHDHHRVQHDETSKLYSEDRLSRWGNPLIIVPKYQTVQSIEYVGVEDTYDIKMYDPHHNFLANGVVVHNCGKSIESANLAYYNKEHHGFQHCLVICCVNSVKYHWQDDIQIHLQEPGYILGSRLRRDGSVRCDGGSKDKYDDLVSGKMYNKEDGEDLPYFLIVNIEAFRYRSGKTHLFTDKIVELINSGYISMVILDEVHKNMSPSSEQGKQIIQVKKKTGDNAMWLPMTGTPITKQPIDVFIPLMLCNGHEFTSFYKWCQYFCVYGGFGGYEIIGYKNISYLKNMLEANMIRRLKEDVLDLPPKIIYTEYVENTEYQRKLYKQVLGEVMAERSEILMSLNPMARLLRLRQVNGSPELIDTELKVDDKYITKNAKLQRLLELVDEIVERGEKVVVFSNWVEPLRTLYKFISPKHKTCVFTGTMSVEDRERNKHVFQTNPEYKVLLGTIGAAGTGHTFTAARNAIFYDSPWNPSDKEQASDRIHRIGTTESVNIFTLVTKDTVDAKVEQVLATKDGVAKYIVDGKLDLRNNPQLFELLLGGN